MTGACPGTVLVQFGANVPGTSYILLGGLLGAAALGYLSDKINWNCDKEVQFIDKKLGWSQQKTSALMAAPLVGGLFALEGAVPWRNDLAKVLNLSLQSTARLKTMPLITSYAWSPLVSGSLIGLLQIPSMYFLGGALGTSTAYEVLLGLITKANILPKSKKLTEATQDSHLQQLIFTVSMILGSFVSTYYGGRAVHTSGNTAVVGVVGGFLLLLGARLANGCTSGHGISGVAQLSTASLVSTAGMFGGGILTSLISKLL